MSLASDLLSVLDKFRTVVAGHVNSGQLVTIDNHINSIANVAENDVQAADDRATDVLGQLYTALHGHDSEPAPTPTAPPVDEGQAAAAVPGTAAASAPATPAKTAAAAPATTSAPAATGTAG
ncbi:hypothetical protein [Streptacidiphilus albus]|uniref:hypothetical protein n=1 Tax=Streptacidiphilus albus TaxID=105425 RepID=UPI00054C2506|nr:hypothetical protein [Streptacidiphilus albus]